MTKEIELLTKILDWYSDENREFSIFQAEKLVKEYAKEMINRFGDYKLSNEIRYDQGRNKEWGDLSYSRQVDKFFEFLAQKQS